jgi:hypothetical protein
LHKKFSPFINIQEVLNSISVIVINYLSSQCFCLNSLPIDTWTTPTPN